MTEIKKPAQPAVPRRPTGPQGGSVKQAATAQATAGAQQQTRDEQDTQRQPRGQIRGPVMAHQPMAQAFAAPGKSASSVGLGRTHTPIARHNDVEDLKNIQQLVETVKQEPRTKGLFGVMSRPATPHSEARQALKGYQARLSNLPPEQRDRQLVKASLSDIKEALK